MPQISRSALVPYSALKMYQLVNDVASYPQFLPGCTGGKVLESRSDSLTAAVDVSKAGICKTFVTRNTMIEGRSIKIELVEGPFQKLFGGWLFTELDETACKIEFSLEFEFKSKLIEIAFGRIFNDLVSNMVQAFTDRAKGVYRV